MNALMRTLVGFVGTCVALSALAQATPSAVQMIEQLQAPRTRSLRNLSVEAALPFPLPSASLPASAVVEFPETRPVDPAESPRPSLSLQIQFDFDSAGVRPESQQALLNLAQALQSEQLLSSRFAVEGHTDAKGRAAYNLKLSAQRAQAVCDFLKTNGVSGDRLVVAGKGAAELANNAAPFAPENRRVRIVNLD